jgi:hypothetical protein
VTAPDVPNGTVLLVDPTEEEWAGTVRQECHASRKVRDVIQIGVAGSDEVVEQALGSIPHGPQRRQCRFEVVLFGLELGIGERRSHGHRGTLHDKERANNGAQISPNMSGIVTPFPLPNKASSWDFPFWSVRTLNL